MRTSVMAVTVLALTLCACSVTHALLDLGSILNQGLVADLLASLGLTPLVGSLLGALVGNPDFSVFDNLAGAGDLLNLLNDPALTATVFLFDNEAASAFEEETGVDVPALVDLKAEVARLVKLHIVVGRKITDFPEGRTVVVTLAGEELVVVNLNGVLSIVDALGRTITVSPNPVLDIGNTVAFLLDSILVPLGSRLPLLDGGVLGGVLGVVNNLVTGLGLGR